MDQTKRSEQNANRDSEPYRNTPEEALEGAWFEEGERLSNPQDLREIATRRWEAELSL